MGVRVGGKGNGMCEEEGGIDVYKICGMNQKIQHPTASCLLAVSPSASFLEEGRRMNAVTLTCFFWDLFTFSLGRIFSRPSRDPVGGKNIHFGGNKIIKNMNPA